MKSYDIHLLYQMFGTDYRFVPEHLRDALLAAHDWHCDAPKTLR